MSLHQYRVAGHLIEIQFEDDNPSNNIGLLPSFAPFRVQQSSGDQTPLFRLTVDDCVKPVDKKMRSHIRNFDTGNGITRVDRLPDGGYQYIIRNIKEADCALLITNTDFSDCRCALNGNYNMRSFGLNNALMLVYAFAASSRQTLLIHASLVRHRGKGYAFTAKSGTGKSTHVSLWLKHIPDCDLMNDDNPVIRIDDDGKLYIYGSPWSGKTPCYRNIKAPLGAITKIVRATSNHVEQLNPIEAFASILPSCSSMKWDGIVFNNICQTVTRIIENSTVYALHCLPNREAAIICHQAIAKP